MLLFRKVVSASHLKGSVILNDTIFERKYLLSTRSELQESFYFFQKEMNQGPTLLLP